jgi:hypothetical protein
VAVGCLTRTVRDPHTTRTVLHSCRARARATPAADRVGWALGPTITMKVAACSTIGGHSMLEGCACLAGVWAKYRTDSAPADLASLASGPRIEQAYTALRAMPDNPPEPLSPQLV